MWKKCPKVTISSMNIVYNSKVKNLFCLTRKAEKIFTKTNSDSQITKCCTHINLKQKGKMEVRSLN